MLHSEFERSMVVLRAWQDVMAVQHWKRKVFNAWWVACDLDLPLLIPVDEYHYDRRLYLRYLDFFFTHHHQRYYYVSSDHRSGSGKSYALRHLLIRLGYDMRWIRDEFPFMADYVQTGMADHFQMVSDSEYVAALAAAEGVD